MVVLSATTVMAVVGLWGLDRGTMWQDEAATYEVAHRSLPQIAALVRNVDVVHALYYAFMHVWMSLGSGDVWLRVPSVLAMSVAAGTVSALGVRLANVQTGAAAGGLFIAMPLVSCYAQEGRSTALVTAAVLLGTYCLVRVLTGAGGRWWAGYATCMVAACVLHEFAVLAFAAHGVTLLVTRAHVAVWRVWCAIAVGCALLVVPIAISSQRQSDQVGWLTRPTRSTMVELAGSLFGTPTWIGLLVLALVVVGVVAGRRPARGRAGVTLVSLALPLLVVPFGILLAVSLVQPLFHVRYVLFAAAGVPLLAAAGAEVVARRLGRSSGRPAVGWALAGLFVAVVFLGQLPAQLQERSVGSRSNDLAAAAAVVSGHAIEGDAVVFMPLRFRAASLAYPEDFTKVHDVAIKQSPIEAANLRGIDRSRAKVRLRMLSEPRIWVVGRTDLRVGSDELGAVNEQAVLRADFVKAATYDVHGMQVALYVRR